MDPRLLKHYTRELQHIREMGGEFAKEFPKIAQRLDLKEFSCEDPYVERLLEGFAFLTARVQLKTEAEFPRFTQHLLEMVYPHYLAPTPSMTIVQFQPDLSEGSLAEGFVVPRQSVLRTPLGKGDTSPCEYRTAHDVTLWPIELAETEYLSSVRDLHGTNASPLMKNARAAIRLRLRCTAGLTFDKIALDSLALHLRGGEIAHHLYEQLLGNAVGMVLRPARGGERWQEIVDAANVRRLGFEQDEALIPYGRRSFQGYRLLHEYSSFPDRFMFVELADLARGVRRCGGAELDIVVVLNRSDPALHNVIDTANFAMFCSPAINLFPKRGDGILLNERQHEYHVVPDRTAPMDYEVYDLTSVIGTGTSAVDEQEFLPFYSCDQRTRHGSHPAYYTLRREPRVLSPRQRQYGARSGYVGSETFISIVDGEQAPFHSELRQLTIGTMCTNRDLALHLSIGQGKTDFKLQAGAPVAAIRSLAGPTPPAPSRAEGETAWRLVSHLSLNYLSMMDSGEGAGAVALRDLLMLYGGDRDESMKVQIDGIRSVHSTPVTRRMPRPGPIAFGRGLEVSLTLDETAFGGSGAFLLGAVLAEFFARYVSLNSFTETVVKSTQRGEITRWPAKTGIRPLL
jgi:type VI secretion system protein ImpG